MSIEEVQQAFDDASKAIVNRFPELIQTLALDTKAVIQDRIQKTGTDASGAKLPGYSTTELPSFFLNAKKKKTKTYINLRKEKGLQTNYVDLTFTGEMWRNTQIVESGNKGEKYVVTIGGGSDSSQNKIDWNSDRYGDILSLSKQEEENISKTYNDEIQKIIDEFLK